jgi:cellulose synthase/poly-beta-1,6-N-acetylglucosamine synthase-like glycosyltransferase
MSLDLTYPSYAILGVVLYFALLFTVSAKRRGPGRFPPAEKPFFVLVVPARNEELVLSNTLAGLTNLSYSGQWRILVMNDGSTDQTAEIAAEWERHDSRIRVVNRTPEEGGRGKSDVLNHAFREVVAHSGLLGIPDDRIVLGIVDADGQLEKNCLERVSRYFDDPSVGTTQIGVRIANARRSLLARMQDMEFVAFSWLVQIARDRIGSSGLGGNGQFTRLSALKSIGGSPWAPQALTEDLDLGLQLVEAGWRTRFCHLTYVDQQGLERWKPLLRQRTRWIQGHYQCWRHIPKLVVSRRAPLLTRLDLSAYLLMVVTVVLVTVNLLLGVLGTLGVVTVTDSFLSGVVPYGFSYRLVSLALSVLPLTIFMMTYQLHSPSRFRWYEVPAAAAVFTLYTYVWFYATLRAWTRMAMGRKSWTKTPRVASVPIDVPARSIGRAPVPA